MEERAYAVVLAGNPNVGKSTVFNALTGLRQHTGNWPGKTVENARGRFLWHGVRFELTDVPGAYSLSARTRDEEAAFLRIFSEHADAIVVVCDASSLVRSLNLVFQILELTKRVVVCANLMDEAERSGLSIDLPLLSRRLGVPVVGTCARSRKGLTGLLAAIERVAAGPEPAEPLAVQYPEALISARERVADAIRAAAEPHTAFGDDHRAASLPRFQALRLIECGADGADRFLFPNGTPLLADAAVSGALSDARAALAGEGFCGSALRDAIVSSVYRTAEEALSGVVCAREAAAPRRQLAADRLLTGRLTGVPVMLALLFLVFYLTISGANAVSDRLADCFAWLETPLRGALSVCGAPAFCTGLLMDGAYRTLAWVVSVMLPPMAIFFPLFTLLEDLGYLPRVAFNLDRPFRRCGGCGRQALTMCMGFGCNAAGVIGCRIIDSPRERLIAMLTNVFVPCNGRFPALITLISLFLVRSAAGSSSPLAAAAMLTLFVLFGVGATFAVSLLLSRTLLKGVPSAFALELPPYRKPQIGRVIVRSVFDRTLFVLGRAAAVAAPAGLVIWLAANLSVNGVSLFTRCTAFLNPVGRLFGMDGTILTAFVLGLPANEIVLPLAAMGYASAGTLSTAGDPAAFGALLTANGWTVKTALCTALFLLFHWPCSTTILTLRRETKSWRWTAVGILLPTTIGLLLCLFVNLIFRLFS